MLGGASDYSTIHEGIIAPIPSGVIKDKVEQFTYEVLATGSIDDISVIVCSNSNNDLIVYKLSVYVPSSIENVWSC